MICPPNSNWRDNVQTAIDCDAAAIIVDVLKLHPGNEDVLDRCANSLGHLCFDQATAEQIADQVSLLLISFLLPDEENDPLMVATPLLLLFLLLLHFLLLLLLFHHLLFICMIGL